MTRTLLLTSTALRHSFVINHLAARLDLVGVWRETKSFQPERSAQTTADRRTIDEHFAARERSERLYFEDHARLRLNAGAHLREVGPGGINDPTARAQMIALAPEVLLVYGTGLLGHDLIEAFEGRIVNLHLGLSPYYRGSGTNFWPLVNREPEYVGATIHYLDAGIDTGPIIAHVQPSISADDGPHDVGNKTILEAAASLAEVAEAVVKGDVRGIPQTHRGRLYQRKDFNAEAVRRLNENFLTGMMQDYLANKSTRDATLQLRTLVASTRPGVSWPRQAGG